MHLKARTPVDRIKKVSKVIARGAKVLQWVAVPVFLISMAIVGIGPVKGVIVHLGGVDIPANLLMSFGSKAMVIFLLCLFFSVFLKGIHHMNRLFIGFSEGNIFSKESIGHIKQLGLTALLGASIELITIPVAVMLVNHTNSEHLNLSFSVPVGNLITGCFVILVAWIMDVGRDMREENELTI